MTNDKEQLKEIFCFHYYGILKLVYEDQVHYMLFQVLFKVGLKVPVTILCGLAD